MNLRLASGELRGRRIAVPAGVRPTESRVREALISIWHPRLPGCRFLDLFAGSGAVGFEAVGLGASHVCFVEEAPRVLAVLKKNRRALAPEAEIVRGRLPEILARRPQGAFDLVFADPPYAFNRYGDLIEAASRRAGPEGEVAVEHSARIELAEVVADWRCRDRRRYGGSCLSFYRFANRG